MIWDNYHANDYDRRRIYLGPYSGRHSDLVGITKGVLTNPNCQYESNFVAIHTLAAWRASFKEKSADIEPIEMNHTKNPDDQVIFSARIPLLFIFEIRLQPMKTRSIVAMVNTAQNVVW